MKRILLAVFVMLSVSVMGQNMPDNELILKNITDGESPYFYPNLFSRYSLGDTSLTAEDYHHLYYGYAFQPEYRPLSSNTAADNLLSVFDTNYQSEEEKNRNILKYALESFKYDPFSPTNLNFLTYAYGQLGDTINEIASYDKLTKVVETIQNSGTGLKEEEAWHVLFFTHSSDIMTLMGLQTAKRMVVSRTTEYIPLLVKKDKKIKGYYFDFSRAYMNKPEDYNQRPRSSGFEFNGIKPKQ